MAAVAAAAAAVPTAASSCSAAGSWLHDTTFGGRSMASQPRVLGPAACCAKCAATPHYCRFFSLDLSGGGGNGTCWLKSSRGRGPANVTGWVSGSTGQPTATALPGLADVCAHLPRDLQPPAQHNERCGSRRRSTTKTPPSRYRRGHSWSARASTGRSSSPAARHPAGGGGSSSATTPTWATTLGRVCSPAAAISMRLSARRAA